jgi:MFS family permease
MWRGRLAGLRVDLTPWRRSRDFRLLLVSNSVFYLGQWVSLVALPYQLYELTGSNFAVGAMGLVVVVPLVVFGLYGGALADHVDRRKMLVATGVAQVLVIALLIGNALLHQPQVWVIYLCGGLRAVATSLQRPSRDALLPRVVAHADMPAAVSLTSLTRQLGQLVGPALGGLLVAAAGVSWAYAVDLGGVLIATVLSAFLAAYPASGLGAAPSLRAMADGIRYAVGRRDLLGTYLVDMVGMFLAMPIVLFPAFATDVLEQPRLLGLLYSAEGIGAVAVTLTSGWARRVHRQGRVVVAACLVWGASVGVAGLAPNIWFAIGCFVVAGAADMVSALFRAVIWNQTIPDEMRGRLAGIEMLSYQLGPLGGQVRSGVVADLTTVRTSIVSGGLMCLAGVAATAAWLRDFWTYDARTDEHAVREREVRASARTLCRDSEH